MYVVAYKLQQSNSPEPPNSTCEVVEVGVTAAICAQLILDSPSGHFGFGVQRPLRRQEAVPGWDKLMGLDEV